MASDEGPALWGQGQYFEASMVCALQPGGEDVDNMGSCHLESVEVKT